MEIYELPYTTWSTLVENNSLAVFQLIRPAERIVYAGSRASGFIWSTTVTAENLTDYTTKYSSEAINIANEADAVAHIIGLERDALPLVDEVRPNLYPEGVTLTFCGKADHATNGRQVGTAFQMSRGTSGESTLEYNFNDWIVLAGGNLRFSSAKYGDWIRYEVYAPASPTPPTSGGTLNCTRVNLGGDLYTIVPASGGSATHYLDLSDPTKWIPVSAQKVVVGTRRRAPDGYWEWSYPAIGGGTLEPRPNKDGWYNLYEFVVDPLARFVVDMPLLGDGQYEVGTGESLRPQTILPHWKHRVTVHNDVGLDTLQVTWMLLVGRNKPTPGNG